MPSKGSELWVKLGLKNQEFKSRLNQSARQLDKVAGDMQKKGRRLSILTRELFMGLALPAGLLANAVFNATKEMDQMHRGLATIAKSKGIVAIDKLLKDTTALAKLPGLGLRESFKGVQNLIALGKSGEDAMRIIKGIGVGISRAGGSAQEFDRVMRQLSQGLSKGKLEMQDFKTVFEQMPESRGILEEYFGPGMSDLDKLRNAGIGVNQVVDALADGFTKLGSGGAMDSLQNATDNLSDSWFVLRATIGQEIFGPKMIQGINWADNTLQSITDTINDMSPATKEVIADMVWFTAKVMGLGLALMGLRKTWLLVGAGFLGEVGAAKIGLAFASMFAPLAPAAIALAAIAGSLSLIYTLNKKAGSQNFGFGQYAGMNSMMGGNNMDAYRNRNRDLSIGGKVGSGALFDFGGPQAGGKYVQAGGGNLPSGGVFGGGDGDKKKRDIIKDINYYMMDHYDMLTGINKESDKWAKTYDDLRETTEEMAKHLPDLSQRSIESSPTALLPTVLDGGSDYFTAIRDGVSQLKAGMIDFNAQLAISQERTALLNEQLNSTFGGAIADGVNGIADAFGTFIEVVLNDGKDAWGAFADATKEAVKKMIVSLVALIAKLAIVAALMAIFAPAAGGIGGFLKGGAGKGGFLDALLGGILGKGGGFADGGIVGGSSPHGDKILARVNSGELILNKGQQAAVAASMNGGGHVRLSGTLVARGRDLVYVLEETQKQINGSR